MTGGPRPSAAEEFAPAKVNLALHVTGRRPDGFHLLESLVCFPAIGDRLTAAPASGLTLALEGPFAAALAQTPAEENLVLRAARLLASEGRGARLRLEKRLPLASGIGGGSADAAAALRLLARLWSAPLPAPEALAALGADIPVCLGSRPARMGGIGERLEPVSLPPFWLVLANPGRPVATGAAFARLAHRDNPALPPLPSVACAADLAEWLRGATRNDLEEPARAIEPAIGAVLAALGGLPSCRLARMSGSGATCFGLFDGAEEAGRAAASLRRAEPGWWVAATPCEAGPGPGRPRGDA